MTEKILWYIVTYVVVAGFVWWYGFKRRKEY